MSKVFNLAFTRGINRDCHSKVFESLCEKIQLPLKSGLVSVTEFARTDRMDLGLMQIRFLEPAMDSEKQKVISLLELMKMADDYKESHEWVDITKEFCEEEQTIIDNFEVQSNSIKKDYIKFEVCEKFTSHFFNCLSNGFRDFQMKYPDAEVKYFVDRGVSP